MSGQQHAPAVLYSRERPGTHCTGGWLGPRAGLESGKSRPTRIRSPDRPARSQSLFQLSYPAHTTTLITVGNRQLSDANIVSQKNGILSPRRPLITFKTEASRSFKCRKTFTQSHSEVFRSTETPTTPMWEPQISRILYSVHSSCPQICSTCSVCLILHEWITLMPQRWEWTYRWRSSIICSFLQPPLTSSLWSPNIVIGTLSTNTIYVINQLTLQRQQNIKS